MRDASSLALLASLFILLVYHGIAILVGRNRLLLAIVFSTLVKLSIFFTVALVLIDALIFIFSLYWSFALTISQIPIGLLTVVGLGAIIAALGLLRSIFALGRRLELTILGKKLALSDNDGLIDVIRSIATKMGARPPDHIVVGLDPAFFVTSANVVVTGEPKKLTGETLYLSAPLLRILKPVELTAVVAHELGHFVGHDTLYSSRFAPIYAQLNQSLDRLSRIEHASDVAKLPGLALLSILMTIFASKERTIGRTRELEADKKAASIAPPEALISALVKVGLVAQRWGELREANIDALNNGMFLNNLCQTFAESVFTMTEHDEALSRMLLVLENERVSHPTDTHPTNAERATNLNVDINAVVNASFSELRQHLRTQVATSFRRLLRRSSLFPSKGFSYSSVSPNCPHVPTSRVTNTPRPPMRKLVPPWAIWRLQMNNSNPKPPRRSLASCVGREGRALLKAARTCDVSHATARTRCRNTESGQASLITHIAKAT